MPHQTFIHDEQQQAKAVLFLLDPRHMPSAAMVAEVMLDIPENWLQPRLRSTQRVLRFYQGLVILSTSDPGACEGQCWVHTLAHQNHSHWIKVCYLDSQNLLEVIRHTRKHLQASVTDRCCILHISNLWLWYIHRATATVKSTYAFDCST